MDNSQKMDILRLVITSLEESTMFSAQEFMIGEGLDNEEIEAFYEDNNFPLALNIIEEFSDNSDQEPIEFLKGEGFSEEEISYILSDKEVQVHSILNDKIALVKAGLN